MYINNWYGKIYAKSRDLAIIYFLRVKGSSTIEHLQGF